MHATVSRVVTRVVNLDADEQPAVRIDNATSGAQFRPTYLSEKMRDGSYSLFVEGPVVTSTGKDHATHRGFTHYSDTPGWRPLSDLPAELRPFLVGPEGLA